MTGCDLNGLKTFEVDFSWAQAVFSVPVAQLTLLTVSPREDLAIAVQTESMLPATGYLDDRNLIEAGRLDNSVFSYPAKG